MQTIPEGANITFSSVTKRVPLSNEPEYITDGANVTLKRAPDNTGAMVYVSKDASLTLTNVTHDGGAVWADGEIRITDDGKGGAGSVHTNNTIDVTAHAPVIVNAGTLKIQEGAIIQNNDNNYAAPA